jgi:DNA-directed RNA polymerase specialized sigma24 family protein
MKADLDRAIKQLTSMQKSIITTLDIAGFNYSEVGYWWGKSYCEINEIEQYSVRQIKRFLNGDLICKRHSN